MDRALSPHYDRIIAPRAAYREYGVEDPRISRVDGALADAGRARSAPSGCARHSLPPPTRSTGRSKALCLDHQNKDMLIFEGRVKNRLMALTRPAGEVYLTPAAGC